MKYEIYRQDINKTVCKEVEAQDYEDAIGKYVSVLMLAGAVKMNNNVVESISDNTFKINRADGRSFIAECRAL